MTERAQLVMTSDGPTCKRVEFIPEGEESHRHDWLCDWNTGKTFYDFCLCGARRAWQLIERCRPLLFVECHLENLPDNGESRASLYALLRELRYRVTFLDGSPVETFEGIEGMTRVVGWPIC